MIHTHQVAKAVVIGLGNIALRHRRNLKLLFPEILIISVPSSGKFENQNVEFADQITLSLDEAIREGVDMAIVASPAPFHALHAKSLGANSEHVENINDLASALKRARESNKSYLISLVTDSHKISPEGGCWWEVAVPEVSSNEKGKQILSSYKESKTKQPY